MGWADVLYQFTGEIVPHTATYARGKAVDPNPTAQPNSVRHEGNGNLAPPGRNQSGAWRDL